MNSGRDRNSARDELAAALTLLREDPRNAMLLRRCAMLAVAAGEPAEALQLADRLLALAPDDAEAIHQRTSALIGLKRFSEAAIDLQGLRDRGYAEPGIEQNLALCLYAEGAYAAACPLLEHLLQRGEVGADVLRLAVSTQHHLGNLDAAIAIADAHPAADERDASLAGVYALAYLDAGRRVEAARYAAVALAAQPDSIDGLTVRGTLALGDLEVAAARAQFQRIVQLAPALGRAWIGLGAIALLEQDYAQATALLERGIAAMPTHSGSRQVLGWAYLVHGDLDNAERVFRSGLEFDRNFAEAHGGLASVLALRGRVAEAQAEIALADRLDRDGLAARFASATLVSRGDPVAARELIRKTAARLVPRLSGVAARRLAGLQRSPGARRH